MKLLQLASLVAAAAAFPGRSGQTLPYSPPLPGDSRSPCPGLNTLANHGYLPHNGRAINGPMMVAAFSKAMNFEVNITEGAVTANFGGIGVDPSVPVDLEVFFVPNVTDVRCSVARDDYKKPVNPARIGLALAQNVMTYVTPDTWGKTRVAIESLTPSKEVHANDIAGGEGTGALMFLSTSQDSHANGDYSNVKARKDWVAVFMGEERFPVELGWKPQAVSPNTVDFSGIIQEITAARSDVLANAGH